MRDDGVELAQLVALNVWMQQVIVDQEKVTDPRDLMARAIQLQHDSDAYLNRGRRQ